MDEAEGVQVLRSRHPDGIAISFTGTREGMTKPQLEKVNYLLRDIWRDGYYHAWHDGDCIGSDSEAHGLVEAIRKEYGDIKVSMIGHPATTHERYHANNKFDIYWPRKGPVDRDKDMVVQGDVLIGTPKGKEAVRSGTWTTIRFARKLLVPLFIVWPDATVTVEIEQGVLDG